MSEDVTNHNDSQAIVNATEESQVAEYTQENFNSPDQPPVEAQETADRDVSGDRPSSPDQFTASLAEDEQ